MSNAESLAKEAMHRKELESDRPVDDAWQPVLESVIQDCSWAGKKLEQRQRVWDAPHRSPTGREVYGGEVLQLFGLAQSITEGEIWK